MDVTSLLPPEVSPVFGLAIVLASFLTSALTAALGLGGGLAMLAILGLGLPSSSLLAVHGIVQLGSNASRVVIQRRFIAWPLALWFFLGSVVGVAVGTPIAAAIPETAAKLALAAFILWSVFGTRPKPERMGRATFVAGGAITSVATMIVGATGALVAGLLSARGLVKQPLVATHATCMVVQHGLKIIAFGLIGFSYAQWAPLLAAMIAMGAFGSWVGTVALDKLPEPIFRRAFKITMTVLALHIVYDALA